MALEANSRDVWPCPLTATGRRSAHSTCAKAFAKEYDFQVVETSDDGNCFFYSLIKFGKRLNFAPLNQDVLSLRKRLVDHIEDHMDEYAPYLSNNNAGTPEEQIETLREDGVWASEAGDLVPLAATNAFNLPIDLYNIEDHGNQDVIRRIPLRPSAYASSSSVPPIPLSILRVHEGHFQLLWPRSAPSASSASSFLSTPSTLSHASKPIQNSSKEEIMTAARSAVEAAQIAVQTAKRVISPSRPSSRPSSLAMSLSKNEHNLKQITRHLNQLQLSASPPSPPAPSSRRVTRSSARASHPPASASLPTRSPPRRKATTRKKKNSPPPFPSPSPYANNNNNNLQRAIQASLQ